jgi:hypothetical protein
MEKQMTILRFLRNLAVLAILALAVLASTPRRVAADDKFCLHKGAVCSLQPLPCCKGLVCEPAVTGERYIAAKTSTDSAFSFRKLRGGTGKGVFSQMADWFVAIRSFIWKFRRSFVGREVGKSAKPVASLHG